MKKFLFLVIGLLVTAVCFAASVDSTAVTSATDTGMTLLWPAISGFLSRHAIIITIVTIISEVLPFIKWTPANGLLSTLWIGFKAIVNFVKGK